MRVCINFDVNLFNALVTDCLILLHEGLNVLDGGGYRFDHSIASSNSLVLELVVLIVSLLQYSITVS